MSRLLSFTAGLLLLCHGCGDPNSAPEAGEAAVPDSAGETKDSVWGTDFAAGTHKSGELGKPLLVYFSGSDWCVACELLHERALGKEEFLRAAVDQYVMVNIDFPQEDKRGDEIKNRNAMLMSEYDIAGFPTLLVLGADGTVYGRYEGIASSPGELLEALRELSVPAVEK